MKHTKMKIPGYQVYNDDHNYEILIKCEPLIYRRAWRAVQRNRKIAFGPYL